MKKILSISLIAVLLVLLTNTDAAAQRRKSTEPKEEKEKTEQTEDAQPAPSTPNKKKKTADSYFDESGGFKHRLQYGFHTNAGILSFFGGSFNLRLEPSVGYKITNWAMAGLTGGIDYYREKYSDRVLSASIFNYGVYARIKAFKSFYLHTDYRELKGKYTTKIITPENKYSINDTYKPEVNVGISYRSGTSTWGYEIMGVYNVNHTDGNNSLPSNRSYSFRDSPLDLKIGFTYNF